MDRAFHPEHLADLRCSDPATADNPRLQEALAYGACGWPVFPCWWPEKGRCACGKTDCPSPAKHPIGILAPHGRNSATAEPEVIKAWWRQYPKANIGIPTGPESGLSVVDLDPRNGSEESLKRLAKEHGSLPVFTPMVYTGGGGLHTYLKHPGHHVKGGSSIAGYAGVDIKGDGGYVLAPPSRHILGNQYTWHIPPDSTPLAPIPDWLMGLLTSEAKPQGAAPVVESIPFRQRNSTLTSLAGSMRRRGMSQEAIEAALLAENQQRCDPPLPGSEVLRIARSVSRYPSQEEGWPDPRELPDPKKPSVPTLPEALLPPPLVI